MNAVFNDRVHKRDDRPVTRFSYSDNDLITLTSNYTLYYYQGVEILQLGKNNTARYE